MLRANPGMIEVLFQDSSVGDGINLQSDSGKTALRIAAVVVAPFFGDSRPVPSSCNYSAR